MGTFTVPEKYHLLEPAISQVITWEDAKILGELTKWLHLGLLQELIAEGITAGELREIFFAMDRTIEAFRKK